MHGLHIGCVLRVARDFMAKLTWTRVRSDSRLAN